jgi:hypothetical protein
MSSFSWTSSFSHQAPVNQLQGQAVIMHTYPKIASGSATYRVKQKRHDKLKLVQAYYTGDRGAMAKSGILVHGLKYW